MPDVQGEPQVEVSLRVGHFAATVVTSADRGALIRAALADIVVTRPADRGLEITVEGELNAERYLVNGQPVSSDPMVSVIDAVQYILLRATLDTEPDELHLHAGHVARAGRSVLIAGSSGSGKSTLVAELVRSGFDYLTDERVAVDRLGDVTSFTKPISLLSGSRNALAWFDLAAGDATADSAGPTWNIPASAIRPGSVITSAEPNVLAFVEYQRRAPLEVTELASAEAVRLLLADSQDAVRIGVDGLFIAANLCARLRCVRIRYGQLSHAQSALEQLLDLGPVKPLAVEPLRSSRPSQHALQSPDAVGLTPGVAVAVIGGRCVIRRPDDGSILTLDETMSAWLQLLDGSTKTFDIVREVAADSNVDEGAVGEFAERVIRDLVEIGVVV